MKLKGIYNITISMENMELDENSTEEAIVALARHIIKNAEKEEALDASASFDLIEIIDEEYALEEDDGVEELNFDDVA